MILYSYDHCPYCVKARMIFGLKAVPFELKTLLNDDESTPIQMIGKKMLPILKISDGECLPESMDIVGFVDSLTEFGEPEVKASKGDSRLDQWLKDVRAYHYRLAMPRWPHMGLEEFKTESAKQYFTKKKEAAIGPFGECLANTESLVAMADEHLIVLEDLCVGGPYFWGEELSADDFHVFSSLRVLTTTQGIKFPEKLDRYMKSMSQLSKVPLHWDQAIGECL